MTAILTAVAFWFQTESLILLGTIFALAGIYMAVQESLESTVTASFVDKEILGTGLGALGMVNGTAKLVSSASVRILWTAISPQFAFGLAALFMISGTLFLVGINNRN